jgi:hypothetical protein
MLSRSEDAALFLGRVCHGSFPALGLRYRRHGSSYIKLSKAGWLTGIVTAFLIALLLAGPPADADEFDPLAVYSEARPLNDRWQACAALFVRRRLQSQQTSQALAEHALDSCRAEQNRLRRFLVAKVGRRAAENVATLLREKYQSDLTAAINELRTRD